MAPALISCFERTIYSKVTIFNFGETIYLKSRADRQAANRYVQSAQPDTYLPHTSPHKKNPIPFTKLGFLFYIAILNSLTVYVKERILLM